MESETSIIDYRFDMNIKKRVGIVTFHESINYGAFLQAYALVTAIERHMNVTAELVNYTPFYKKLFYYVKAMSKISKGQFFSHLFQIQAFRRSQKYLKLSNRLMTGNYAKHCEYINATYDAVVIGSDEVLTAGGNRFMSFPNVYWPNDLVNIPKLTYAGSANRANYNKLSAADRAIATEIFRQYKYIGVRDFYSREQVLSLDSKLVTHINCDPTFLVDFNEEFKSIREPLVKRFGKLTNKPILALMTKNNELGLELKRQFGKDYFILAVYYPNDGADYFMADMTPKEWAVAFSIYKACVSQLFHATVFCLKNSLPFVSFDNSAEYDGRETKISDLLKRTSLLDSYFNMREANFKYVDLVTQLRSNIEHPATAKMQAAVESQKTLFNPFIHTLKTLLN